MPAERPAHRRWLCLLLCGVGLVLWSQQALGQQPAPAPGAGQPGAATAPTATTPTPRALPQGGGKMIMLEEEVIEGRVQKPEVFLVLPRNSLNYRSLELQKSFLPAIVEAVKKQPV